MEKNDIPLKYLGVLIDSHLTFSYHMNSISTKLSGAIELLVKSSLC